MTNLNSGMKYKISHKTNCLYFSTGLIFGIVLLATFYTPPSLYLKPLNDNSLFGQTDQHLVARFVEKEMIELNPRSDQSTESSIENKKRKVVIILTFMRSGSTFLGEIFNNHPDSFYQFEPLHEFYKFGCDDKTDEKYESLVKKLNCNFHDLLDNSKKWTTASKNFTLQQILERKGNFNFRYKTRRLCKPPFCHTDQSDTIEGCKFHCESVNSDHASRVCNESVPIIKTIRFCDISRHLSISKLAKLMNETNLDPKFIFLVRDPRGILNSRMKIYTSEKYKKADRDRGLQKLVQNVVPVCNNTMNNLIFLKNNSEMARRTLVVRYEDIAASPFDYSKKILQHVEMDFHQDVQDWILENTKTQNNETQSSFTTSRDSKRTALMWREELHIGLAKFIDGLCKGEMKQMGYLPITGNKLGNATEVIQDFQF